MHVQWCTECHLFSRLGQNGVTMQVHFVIAVILTRMQIFLINHYCGFFPVKVLLDLAYNVLS